jgi:hypothetical protein
LFFTYMPSSWPLWRFSFGYCNSKNQIFLSFYL